MMPLMIFAACRIRSMVPSQTAAASFRLRALLVATYTLMTVLTVPQILVVLGLYDANSTNFTWFTTYSLISTLLMGGLLYLHSKQIDGLREDLERELADAKRQAEMESARVGEQSELVTMLTHELKTPLSVVSLALGGSGITRPQMRERALRSVSAMQAVIDRCAQIARFDYAHPGGDDRLLHREIDATLALRDVVAMQKDAENVDIEAPPGMLTCRADRQLLLLVLGNLLDNALKYTPPGMRVMASVRAVVHAGRPGVAFCVSNPVGRAGRPDVDHLFEKYHRGAHARYRSGSGLGLYLCHRLATRMDGELSLLEGEDVRFELRLPG
jgi:signal transduction histidine kinase